MSDEKSAIIELKSGGKFVRNLEVPFSLTEVDRIKELRLVREMLGRDAMAASGRLREMYVSDLDIPWGYKMIPRESALERMKKTIIHIGEEVGRHPGSFNDTQIGNLKTIQHGLIELVPSDMLDRNLEGLNVLK